MANRLLPIANRLLPIANRLLFLVFLLLLLAICDLQSAWSAYEWEVPLPPAPGGATLSTDSIDSLFNYIYSFGLGLGGFFAFVRLIFAGILWGAEGAGIVQKQSALDIIKNTIFGLLLLLFSWVILNTINPQILNLDLAISKAEPAQEQRSGLAGVFDSLANSSQRKSIDEVIKNISEKYLVQGKPDIIKELENPRTQYLFKSTETPAGGQDCEAGQTISLNSAGLTCLDSFSSVFNCDTPLSCVLINDLLELQALIDFRILTGSEYGTHQEQRAADIELYNSLPESIDPRDQLIVEFLNIKKEKCGDELFAPAKFGDLCYFISNNQATSSCSFFENQIHYSIRKDCQ